MGAEYYKGVDKCRKIDISSKESVDTSRPL